MQTLLSIILALKELNYISLLNKLVLLVWLYSRNQNMIIAISFSKSS